MIITTTVSDEISIQIFQNLVEFDNKLYDSELIFIQDIDRASKVASKICDWSSGCSKMIQTMLDYCDPQKA